MSDLRSRRGIDSGPRRTPCLRATVLRSGTLFLELGDFPHGIASAFFSESLLNHGGSSACLSKLVQWIHMHHPLIHHQCGSLAGREYLVAFLIKSADHSASCLSDHAQLGYVPATVYQSRITGRRSVSTIIVCPIFPVLHVDMTLMRVCCCFALHALPSTIVVTTRPRPQRHA